MWIASYLADVNSSLHWGQGTFVLAVRESENTFGCFLCILGFGEIAVGELFLEISPRCRGI